MDEICAFCKQFDLRTDGFICKLTGKDIMKDDNCNEFEAIT